MSDPIELTPDLDPRTTLGDFETSLWLPRLSAASQGGWSVRLLPVTAARGYWGRGYRTRGAVLLTGPLAAAGAAWMSLVPMEIESQEIGIAATHGHTVVLGLGLGWCAANVARNPAVERVTVIERDRDVIGLIEALGIFGKLPAEVRAKVRVVEGDALTWRPGERVDCVHADIWATLLGQDRWDQVRRIDRAIGAASLYFWGRELELWRLACRRQDSAVPTWSVGDLAVSIAQTGLPLIGDRRPCYAARIAEAARWWAPGEHGWWNSGGA